jgi:hypothetical protein
MEIIPIFNSFPHFLCRSFPSGSVTVQFFLFFALSSVPYLLPSPYVAVLVSASSNFENSVTYSHEFYVWNSPTTRTQCQDNVDLYIHSPICLHGIVKVKVTLRLTVSQSVSQYVLVSSPNMGHLTRDFSFFFF